MSYKYCPNIDLYVPLFNLTIYTIMSFLLHIFAY